jgi:hypothetical protein
MERVKEDCIRKVTDATTALKSENVTPVNLSPPELSKRSLHSDKSNLLYKIGSNIMMSPHTPRIQKMFDSAYGQGIVDVSAALKREDFASRSEPKIAPAAEAIKVNELKEDVDLRETSVKSENKLLTKLSLGASDSVVKSIIPESNDTTFLQNNNSTNPSAQSSHSKPSSQIVEEPLLPTNSLNLKGTQPQYSSVSLNETVEELEEEEEENMFNPTAEDSAFNNLPLSKPETKIEISQKLMMFSRGFKAGISGASMSLKSQDPEKTMFARGMRAASLNTSTTGTPVISRTFASSSSNNEDAGLTSATTTTAQFGTKRGPHPLFKTVPVIPTMPMGSPSSDIEESTISKTTRYGGSAHSSGVSSDRLGPSQRKASAPQLSSSLAAYMSQTYQQPSSMFNIQETSDETSAPKSDTFGRSFSKRGIKSGSHEISSGGMTGAAGSGSGGTAGTGVGGADSTSDSDVFERLATSHTLASQAKMVHRESSLNSLNSQSHTNKDVTE